MDQNLKNIIEGCQESDPVQQEQLYKLFYNFGLTICTRYAYTQEEAREILNDAFVKIFRNIHRYQFRGAFRSWIYPIFVNCAVDYYRKFYERKGPQPIGLDFVETTSVPPDIFQSLDYRALLQLIRLLPPAYGVVFNLAVVEGYKHAEIAEMLNISEGTSKSNLSRAKNKMKAMILAQNLVADE